MRLWRRDWIWGGKRILPTGRQGRSERGCDEEQDTFLILLPDLANQFDPRCHVSSAAQKQQDKLFYNRSCFCINQAYLETIPEQFRRRIPEIPNPEMSLACSFTLPAKEDPSFPKKSPEAGKQQVEEEVKHHLVSLRAPPTWGFFLPGDKDWILPLRDLHLSHFSCFSCCKFNVSTRLTWRAKVWQGHLKEHWLSENRKAHLNTHFGHEYKQ